MEQRVSIFDPARSPWPSRMLSLLRIVVGVVFIEHGTQKMFGFPPGNGPAMSFNIASQFGVAGVLETFGGLCMILGFLTRPVAFVLAGEMAVAYFQVHFPKSPFPIQSGGDLPVLFCFIYLYLMVAGGGIWSIDDAITRSRRSDGPHTIS
jgi:putative oxidoreductase